MKKTEVTQRLAGSGGDKWEIHLRARQMMSDGVDVIELTIGEPDIPTPTDLMDEAYHAMKRGRTGYSDGRGEIGLRMALAEHYSRKVGRSIKPDQILCFPGTQTALFTVFAGLTEKGDTVLVGDPMYATYEGTIRASGAELVSIPLRPENEFRLKAEDVEARITKDTRALLLTTPHNPTGAILTKEDIADISTLARDRDFWIISDEVYDQLTFDGQEFHSPLSDPALANHVIVTSSISKSHAAPGFRSGWCVAPLEIANDLLPLSEAMLFGNQPFIADMTEKAIREGSNVAKGMAERFSRRADLIADQLDHRASLRVHKPQAGMFALIDISSTGMNSEEYASDLLEKEKVAVMPGISFGETLNNWVRVALTVDDDQIEEACNRISRHATNAAEKASA